MSQQAEQRPTTGVLDRVVMVLLGLLLAAVSLALMISTHRVHVDLFTISWPVGLVFGAVLQLAASIFLLSSGGSRLPLLVFLIAWGMGTALFAGTGAGGGVLMPAVIEDRIQFSGWIVQGLGILIPLAVLGVDLVLRLRRTAPRRAR